MVRPPVIWLIDDDEISNFINEEIINETGMIADITSFTNAKSALDLLLSSRKFPDYIFLDLNMPIMDGFEFLSALKEKRNIGEFQIVVLTSSINPNDADKISDFCRSIRFKSKPLESIMLSEIFSGRSGAPSIS